MIDQKLPGLPLTTIAPGPREQVRGFFVSAVRRRCVDHSRRVVPDGGFHVPLKLGLQNTERRAEKEIDPQIAQISQIGFLNLCESLQSVDHHLTAN